MPKLSAGILLYRHKNGKLEVFLVHPGGPFWAKKDKGAWSLPKGEYTEEEEALTAAKREFTEETGQPVPDGDPLALGEVKYGNKRVVAWAVEGEIDASRIVSNTFQMEWPPRSGKIAQFPEIDRANWFTAAKAEEKLVGGQAPFIGRLYDALGITPPEEKTTPEQISLL